MLHVDLNRTNESMTTFRFGARAKKVKNKLQRVLDYDRELSERREVGSLKSVNMTRNSHRGRSVSRNGSVTRAPLPEQNLSEDKTLVKKMVDNEDT
jgi:hypothetical protein